MAAGVTVKRRDVAEWVPAALVTGAFLAPGAWLITRLPPVPIAKGLNLATAAVWLIVVGAGVIALRRPDRWVLRALGAVLAVLVASLLAGGHVFHAVFYDLYADMPLVQWLALLVVFALSAAVAVGPAARRSALGAVVAVGAALAVVVIVQQATTAHVWVFGSTGYSTTALVPLIPLATGLGGVRGGRARLFWYGAAVLIAIALALFSGSTMGLLGASFGVAVAVAAHPGLRLSRSRSAVVARSSAALVAASMIAVMLVATVPALGGRWVNPESVAAFDKNVVGRAYMWQGAQAMVAERPLLGFGPAGYRMFAAEYLAPQALQFGSDRPGDIDPAVYSPQSPHSLVWDIATRLGLAGLAAFAALLAAWIVALRRRLREAEAANDLRLPLAAGFVAGLFSLMVNPPIFAIGLLLPALAGLAIAPVARPAEPESPASSPARLALVVAGVLFLLVAGWLSAGEWRAYTVPTSDAAEARAGSQSVLAVLPGHPVGERRVLEMDLIMAPDAAAASRAQAAVDAAPGYIAEFAPNLVSLAAFSLAQAERTGRTDLSWEAALLDLSAELLPPTPALVAERLHLAVLSGDEAEVAAAMPEARTWGMPYPLTQVYLERAEALAAP